MDIRYSRYPLTYMYVTTIDLHYMEINGVPVCLTDEQCVYLPSSQATMTVTRSLGSRRRYMEVDTIDLHYIDWIGHCV